MLNRKHVLPALLIAMSLSLFAAVRPVFLPGVAGSPR
jgi:hypothetical protein